MTFIQYGADGFLLALVSGLITIFLTCLTWLLDKVSSHELAYVIFKLAVATGAVTIASSLISATLVWVGFSSWLLAG